MSQTESAQSGIKKHASSIEAVDSQLKILVAIASYGTGNDKFLARVIEEYQSMPYSTHIVVLSNVRKDLPAGVELIVGLPTKNPRSLPFAHKRVFAERAEQYDLFIYTEDDILTTKRNIDFFLKSCKELRADEIAGFLRIEKAQDGRLFFPEFHRQFHWEPGSVRQRGAHTYAFFTNEHAAVYMITRAQLRRALQSGGFLLRPRQDKYQMLETAATDIYTKCGFTKMVAVSNLQDVTVHHMPNKYIGHMGIEADDVHRQIAALTSSNGTNEASAPPFETDTRCQAVPFSIYFSKSYYEPAREDVLSLVPENCRNVLSIGCGWGQAEKTLIDRGISVSAVPLDSIIAACAEQRGVRILGANLDDVTKQSTKKFDCVLIPNLLHLATDPVKVLSELSACLTNEGALIAVVPSFRLGALWKLIGRGLLLELFSYQRSGVHFSSKAVIQRWFKRSGLSIKTFKNVLGPQAATLSTRTPVALDSWLATEFVVLAQKI